MYCKDYWPVKYSHCSYMRWSFLQQTTVRISWSAYNSSHAACKGSDNIAFFPEELIERMFTTETSGQKLGCNIEYAKRLNEDGNIRKSCLGGSLDGIAVAKLQEALWFRADLQEHSLVLDISCTTWRWIILICSFHIWEHMLRVVHMIVYLSMWTFGFLNCFVFGRTTFFFLVLNHLVLILTCAKLIFYEIYGLWSSSKYAQQMNRYKINLEN